MTKKRTHMYILEKDFKQFTLLWIYVTMYRKNMDLPSCALVTICHLPWLFV